MDIDEHLVIIVIPILFLAFGALLAFALITTLMTKDEERKIFKEPFTWVIILTSITCIFGSGMIVGNLMAGNTNVDMIGKVTLSMGVVIFTCAVLSYAVEILLKSIRAISKIRKNRTY